MPRKVVVQKSFVGLTDRNDYTHETVTNILNLLRPKTFYFSLGLGICNFRFYARSKRRSPIYGNHRMVPRRKSRSDDDQSVV